MLFFAQFEREKRTSQGEAVLFPVHAVIDTLSDNLLDQELWICTFDGFRRFLRAIRHLSKIKRVKTNKTELSMMK